MRPRAPGVIVPSIGKSSSLKCCWLLPSPRPVPGPVATCQLRRLCEQSSQQCTPRLVFMYCFLCQRHGSEETCRDGNISQCMGFHRPRGGHECSSVATVSTQSCIAVLMHLHSHIVAFIIDCPFPRQSEPGTAAFLLLFLQCADWQHNCAPASIHCKDSTELSDIGHRHCANSPSSPTKDSHNYY